MATCPAGHETNHTDFCDVCGLPIAGGTVTATPTPAQPQAAPVVTCPNCRTPNVADALFCEACGFDFTTGTLPAPVVPTWPTLEQPAPVAEQPAPVAEQPAPVSELPAPVAETPPVVTEDPAAAPASPSTPQQSEDQPVEAPADEDPAVSDSPASDTTPPAVTAPGGDAPPAQLQPPPVDWIAELWIDPDWYATQGSTDPMPSAGLPDIVPLVKDKNLVGRVSHSRGIFPDVDCELDSGVSRRHAMLTTDGNRWWIEDLNSANGTFVGAAAGPLPAMPIPQGRVELSPGQRIYVGAWTRIVIRRATDDERTAFAG
jgi:hypothetical protein